MERAALAVLGRLLGKAQETPTEVHLDSIEIDETELAYMRHELRRMGIKDAGETPLFTRQLEYVKTKTYDVLYLEAEFRKHLPISNETPTGATSVTWRQFNWNGEAKIIHSYARDFPRVDLSAKEETTILHSVGSSYGYSIQDLRASQMAGIPLDTRKGQAARTAIELQLDSIAALGSSSHNLVGFAKNSGVNLITATTGGWSSASFDTVLADLLIMVRTVMSQSTMRHRPNVIFLPTASFLYASSVTGGVESKRTAVSAFHEIYPDIEVVPWPRLDSANASNNGGRAVVGEVNPINVEVDIPQDFEQFPPQATGMEFEIFCHARTGGTRIYYTLAFAYCDEL